MTAPEANADQREYWNADEARHWVDEQAAYDRMLAPFAARLLEGAAIASGESVVDIGCGTGSTTCDAARAASGGHALGLDISRAMVEGARARAIREEIDNVTFEVGDAQTRTFETGVGRPRHEPLRRDVLRRAGARLREPPHALCDRRAA